MLHKVWAGENRKFMVCVDSYEGNVLRGRLYHTYREMESFNSLTQFLVGVEDILEEQQIPQSYTSVRKFSDLLNIADNADTVELIRKGAEATFEIQILFRQHTSWQGVIIWRERKMEQSFRSVLELVLLMDSALRAKREGVAS